MGVAELFFIAVGLSMDAFAVSVCKGLGMKKLSRQRAVIIPLFFGGFQAAMPLIGWILGRQFSKYILTFDHWIAFVLLAYIGGKMMHESACDNQREVAVSSRLDYKEITMLAVATSIDALAVGITFAFLPVHIPTALAVIGITTFVLSTIGIVIGQKFGSSFENKAEIIGGIILIAIGTKILLEHLGILKL